MKNCSKTTKQFQDLTRVAIETYTRQRSLLRQHRIAQNKTCITPGDELTQEQRKWHVQTDTALFEASQTRLKATSNPPPLFEVIVYLQIEIRSRKRFYVMAGSKSSLLIDSSLTCMQSTETTFPEMLPARIPRIC